MSGSAEERAIRDGIVPRLRELCPDARIVHELNVDHGKCRVDIAAIQDERLTFVEIKSKKDTLDRLPEQVKVFSRACHAMIVVLDEKFFGERYAERLKAAGRFSVWSGDGVIWKWPRPCSLNEPVKAWRGLEYDWQPAFFQARGAVEPHAMRLLELLWAEELRDECERHRIPCNSRSARWPMIQAMVLSMNGREIRRSVCRQLRQRSFAEGDVPLVERLVA